MTWLNNWSPRDFKWHIKDKNIWVGIYTVLFVSNIICCHFGMSATYAVSYIVYTQRCNALFKNAMLDTRWYLDTCNLIPQLEGQNTHAFDGIYISWSHPYTSTGKKN
jgi:hypothetical protein